MRYGNICDVPLRTLSLTTVAIATERRAKVVAITKFRDSRLDKAGKINWARCKRDLCIRAMNDLERERERAVEVGTLIPFR